MNNDLVTGSDIDTLSAGELQPYNPGQPLAPMNHDSWANNTDVDLLNERQHQPKPITLFGWALPQGTTEAMAQAALDTLARSFEADFKILNYPADTVHFAIQFYKDNAFKAPENVTPRHDLKLPGELAGDWLAIKFANHLMDKYPHSRPQRQGLLDNTIKWLAKLVKNFESQHLGVVQGQVTAHGRAPQTSDPTANLTDAEFEQLVKANQRAAAHTEQVLRSRWGDTSYACLLYTSDAADE